MGTPEQDLEVYLASEEAKQAKDEHYEKMQDEAVEKVISGASDWSGDFWVDFGGSEFGQVANENLAKNLIGNCSPDSKSIFADIFLEAVKHYALTGGPNGGVTKEVDCQCEELINEGRE